MTMRTDMRIDIMLQAVLPALARLDTTQTIRHDNPRPWFVRVGGLASVCACACAPTCVFAHVRAQRDSGPDSRSCAGVCVCVCMCVCVHVCVCVCVHVHVWRGVGAHTLVCCIYRCSC